MKLFNVLFGNDKVFCFPCHKNGVHFIISDTTCTTGVICHIGVCDLVGNIITLSVDYNRSNILKDLQRKTRVVYGEHRIKYNLTLDKRRNEKTFRGILF